MASYHHWMVYLPDYNAFSFLLYTHHVGGEMALRDFSQGYEDLLPAPLRGHVLQATEDRVTRFPAESHTVRDLEYWVRMTANYNRTELADATAAVGLGGR
jgi:hypothetical protein